jgi:hypothetical protein
VAKKKRNKKRDYTPRLRPQNKGSSSAKHGVYSLERLLRGDLDGRLAIAKQRNQLEAQWIDYCGGPDCLTPPVMGLIKRIVHKELLAAQSEKMALLGEYDLSDKKYLALTNSQRLDKEALQRLLNSGKPKGKVPSIQEIIEAEGNEHHQCHQEPQALRSSI